VAVKFPPSDPLNNLKPVTDEPDVVTRKFKAKSEVSNDWLVVFVLEKTTSARRLLIKSMPIRAEK
jgi:hypothetical protein